MSTEAYYYMFSVIAVIVAALHATNLAWFKTRHKTLFGQSYKKGSQEYIALSKFTTTKASLVISAAILVLLGNLIVAGYQLASIGTSTARLVLVAIPLVLIIVAVIVFSLTSSWLKSKKVVRNR